MRGFCLYIHSMRTFIKIIGVTLLLFILGLSFALFSSNTGFDDRSSVDVYISTGTKSIDSVRQILERTVALSDLTVFNILISFTDYENHIIPGRYKIEKGMSTFRVFRKLVKGRTDDVKLVINKLRTKEDLAGLFGRKLEPDSTAFMSFFNNADSTQQLGVNPETIVTLIIPNTYQIDWTNSVSTFLRRMKREHDLFWTTEREEKRQQLGLSKEQVYILASIVEEETNKHDEKPTISSVYLNRMKRNMPLGADPTVKFALRDFGIKRINFAHIRNSASSPYNTYTNKGLPPGPICTPSSKSIDGVLNAAKTDYIFFCARPDFSGYHSFASNETDHFKNAKAYQKALDSLMIH